LLPFVLYFCIFQSLTGNFLLNFANRFSPHIQWSGNVDRFSLFFGVSFDELSVFTKSDPTPLFQAKRLELYYSLPKLILGKVDLSSIQILEGRLNLKQEDGRWNFENPNQSKEQEELEPETPEDESSEISLPIAVSIHTKFAIKDFQCLIQKSKSGEVYEKQELGPLNLDLEVQSKSMDSIPKDLGILFLWESINLEINKNHEFVLIETKENSTLKLNPKASILLNSKNDELMLDLDINLKNQSNRIPPVLLKSKIYLGKDNRSDEGKFVLGWDEETWIDSKITTNSGLDPELDWNWSTANIDLSSISRWLIQNNIPLKINGRLNLAGTRFQYKAKKLLGNLELESKGISFEDTSKLHKITSLGLGINITLDLSKEVPIRQLEVLSMDIRSFDYNELKTQGKIKFENGSSNNGEIFIKSNRLASLDPSLKGKAEIKLNWKSNSLFDIPLRVSADLNPFQFTIGESQSPPSKFVLNSQIDLRLGSGGSPNSVDIKSTSLQIFNAKSNKAIQVGIDSLIDLQKKPLSVPVGFGVKIFLSNISSILPYSLQSNISSLKDFLGNELELKGKILTSLSSSKTIIQLILNGAIPGLNLNDLKINSELSISSTKNGSNIQWKNTSLGMWNDVIQMNSLGKLENGIIDTDYKISVQSNGGSQLGNKGYIKGNLNLTGFFKDKTVQGNLNSDIKELRVILGDCLQKDCKIYEVNGIESDFPFEHILNRRSSINFKSSDESNPNWNPKPNFKISRILGTHPMIPNTPFLYTVSKDGNPSISLNLQYKDNQLIWKNLNINTMDGTIRSNFGNLILSDLDPKNMSFQTKFSVRDLDLKQLLPIRSQKKIDDGKIKLDLNLKVNSFMDIISDTELNCNVYQIGRDFGKNIMNIISPSGILMDSISNAYSVDTVNFELSRGLVYVDVQFKETLTTYFLSLYENKISQERMPLANFLKKAENEISTYK
jgi:hypothetical protein